jgi:3-polyprenyl-4-hydroxybenzoate decarboxylase
MDGFLTTGKKEMTLQDYTDFIYNYLITDHSKLTVPENLDYVLEEIFGPGGCDKFYRALIERMMDNMASLSIKDGMIVIPCDLYTFFSVFAEFCEPLIEKATEEPKEVQDAARV